MSGLHTDTAMSLCYIKKGTPAFVIVADAGVCGILLRGVATGCSR
jgi:hypothetical protein